MWNSVALRVVSNAGRAALARCAPRQCPSAVARVRSFGAASLGGQRGRYDQSVGQGVVSGMQLHRANFSSEPSSLSPWFNFFDGEAVREVEDIRMEEDLSPAWRVSPQQLHDIWQVGWITVDGA